MGSSAPEVVESGSARRRKYTKAAWCEVYSLARLWFERLEVSRRVRCKESEERGEHRSQQRAAIAAFLVALHHIRGMMISTTEEKWVGVIADKGGVARKAVWWCFDRSRLPAPCERLKGTP